MKCAAQKKCGAKRIKYYLKLALAFLFHRYLLKHGSSELLDNLCFTFVVLCSSAAAAVHRGSAPSFSAPCTKTAFHSPQPVPMPLLSLAVALLAALFAPASCGADQLPSVSVPACTQDSPAALPALFLSNGSAAFPARTAISLCWTPDNLVAEFLCQDDPMLRNDFAECNSPMYNQVIRFAPCALSTLTPVPSYVTCDFAGSCGVIHRCARFG
jgi:hypothetical protein